MAKPIAAIVSIAFAALTAHSSAQPQTAYTARLSFVPISGAERRHVSGSATASATLEDDTLSITGRFEALPGPATLAALRRGVAIGASGPVVAEIDIAHETHGRFDADVPLDADTLAALRAGRVYVQLHAEGGVPPDGAVLRGWLLDSARSTTP